MIYFHHNVTSSTNFVLGKSQNVNRTMKSIYKQRGGQNSRCFVTAILLIHDLAQLLYLNFKITFLKVRHETLKWWLSTSSQVRYHAWWREGIKFICSFVNNFSHWNYQCLHAIFIIECTGGLVFRLNNPGHYKALSFILFR